MTSDDDRVETTVVKGLIGITIVCLVAATALAAVCMIVDKPLSDTTPIMVPLLGIATAAVGSLGTRRTRIGTNPSPPDTHGGTSSAESAPPTSSAGDRLLGDLLGGQP